MERTLIDRRNVVRLLVVGRFEIPGMVRGQIGPHALRVGASHDKGEGEQDAAHRGPGEFEKCSPLTGQLLHFVLAHCQGS